MKMARLDPTKLGGRFDIEKPKKSRDPLAKYAPKGYQLFDKELRDSVLPESDSDAIERDQDWVKNMLERHPDYEEVFGKPASQRKHRPHRRKWDMDPWDIWAPQ
uniref:Uncharacterized protein n=2 Tax=Lotharella globosa TaxID=91324 RepID=A0A6V3KRY4_9EUKA